MTEALGWLVSAGLVQLVNMGADPNHPDSAPLVHCASWALKPDMVRMLLHCGPYLNRHGRSGGSALVCLVANFDKCVPRTGHEVEVMSMLLNVGASPSCSLP